MIREAKPITFILLFIFCALSYAGQPPFKEVCFKDACVRAQISDTDIKRRQGLMFREFLSDNEGMIFIFPDESRHSFWMKNMKIPLDIIWINKNKFVVDIKPDLEPCAEINDGLDRGHRIISCPGFTPKDNSLYALEVNAGFALKNDIKIGDKADF